MIEHPSHARARLTLGLSLLLVGSTLAACRDLTSLAQENPGQLSAATMYVPANAQLLVNGAIGDFECAFTRYVVGSGLFADELTDAISSSTNFDYDRRTLPTNATYGTNTCASGLQSPGIYTPLSTARASADTIAAKLEGWTDAQVAGRVKLLGQSYTYAGYSLILLGEGMCSAAINLGPEIQPAAIFAEAKTRFDKAIADATTAGDATTLSLATIGRARAEQDLGKLSDAAADAAKITSSAYLSAVSMDAVNPRRQNTIYVTTVQNFYSSVDPSFRNVTWQGVPDPRVPTSSSGKPGTNGAIVWQTAKATSFTSPITLAKWSEAQLIIAENDVATGDLNGAATIINGLHAKAGIPAYDNTGQSAAQVLAQVIEERRREFFLEGHRLGDIHHFALTIQPASGTTYPYGGVYGSQTCFPLPDVERINNPNIGH